MQIENLSNSQRQLRQNIRNAYFCESVEVINTAIDQFCVRGGQFEIECLKELREEIEKENENKKYISGGWND